MSTLLYETRTRLQRHSGPTCLEIRSRNEEVINSTRNTSYSLKVFYFLLYRCRYVLFVSELIYTVVRVLATPKNTSAVAAYMHV